MRRPVGTGDADQMALPDGTTRRQRSHKAPFLTYMASLFSLCFASSCSWWSVMNRAFCSPNGGFHVPVVCSGNSKLYTVHLTRGPTNEERHGSSPGTPGWLQVQGYGDAFRRTLTIQEVNQFVDSTPQYIFMLTVGQTDALASSTQEHFGVDAQPMPQIGGNQDAGASLRCIVNHVDGCYHRNALLLSVTLGSSPGDAFYLVVNRLYFQ